MIPWRREWQPTPVFLPGGSHGQRSQVGYSPWDCKELDMTERLSKAHTTVLYTVLCNKVHKSTTTCTGCTHMHTYDNVRQTLELTDMTDIRRSVSCLVVSDSLQHNGLESARHLCPWASPGKNTGVGCHALLKGIFLTQELNPSLPRCGQILYCLSYQRSP